MCTRLQLLTLSFLLLVLSALGCTTGQAETYPARPVKVIIPAGAATSPDVLARIVANHLTQVWTQQVVVINRPGGGGIIAAQAAATSEPDGYTLFFGLASTFVVLPETQDKFDPHRAFVPISLVSEQPFLIAAASMLGVNTLADTIALAKKKPEGLLYAANFRGSLPHMAGELLAARAGIKLTHVPYPGVGPALNDVISGRIGLIVDSMPALSGAVASGTVKPLAVAAARRLPDFAELPTASETIAGFEASGWFALMAPAGVSSEIVHKVNRDLRDVLAQSELQRKFQTLGTYARPMSPPQTVSFIRSEQDRWRPLVRDDLAKAP